MGPGDKKYSGPDSFSKDWWPQRLGVKTEAAGHLVGRPGVETEEGRGEGHKLTHLTVTLPKPLTKVRLSRLGFCQSLWDNSEPKLVT